MATQRISGTMLDDNLAREGTNLTFETDLLVLDVSGNQVGIKKAIPTKTLDITGTLGVSGETTMASAIVSDLTVNRIVLAGAAGAISDNANFTFDGTTFTVGATNIVQSSGNTTVGGILDVTGIVTLTDTLNANGAVNLGDTAGDIITVAGTTTFTPSVDFDGGFTTATGQSISFGATNTISMGSNRVQNVTDPSANQDAATKKYVDDTAFTGFTTSDGIIVTTGSFVTSRSYEIVNVGDTDFTLIGATSNTSGLTFVASGAGGGTTGTARAAYDVSGSDTLIFTGTTGEINVNSNTVDQMQIGLTDDVTITNNLSVTNDFNAASSQFTVANTTGNTLIGGTLGVTGESTLASAIISDLTDNRIVIAGTAGIVEDDANFTFDGTTLTVGATSIIHASGNTSVGGTLGVTNEATLASAIISDLTNDRIVIAGTSGAVEDDANFTFDGTTFTIGSTPDKFTVAVTSGNTAVAGTLGVTGESTLASAIISDLIDNRVLIAGTAGAIEDDATFTYDGATLTVGATSITQASGNTSVGGTLGVTGESTLASVIISDLTDNRVLIAGIAGAIEDDATFTYDGATLTVGATSITQASGNTSVGGTLTVTGVLTANGAVNIGSDGADIITVLGTTTFTPSVDFDGGFTTAAGQTITYGGTNTISMGSNQVHDVTDPTLDQDAATKKYVDDTASTGFTASDGISVTAGSFVTTRSYEIETIGSTDYTLIGAASNTVGINFVASGPGVGTGTARAAYNVSGDDTFIFTGTTNEIDVNANTIDQIQIGLPSDVTITNDLSVTNDFNAASSQFTIANTTGNTIIGGTLDVTGLASLDGGIDVDGAFTVANTTGDILTTGSATVQNIEFGVEGATTISTTAGNTTLTIDPDTAGTGGTVIIQGDLQITGTTTTFDSTTVSIADPVFELGDDTVDDNLDRGLKMKYHNGSTTKAAFIGMDDSSTVPYELVWIPDATDTSSTFTGSLGNVAVGSIRVTDLTDNRILIAGANGEVEDDANFTFDGTNFIAPSALISDITDNRVVLGGPLGALEDDANFTFDGTTFNIGAGNFTVAQASGNTVIAGTLTANGAVNIGSDGADIITVLGTTTFTPSVDFDGGFTVANGQTVDVGSNKILNVTDPTLDQDAATKKYVDDTAVTGFTASDNITVTTGSFVTSRSYEIVNVGDTDFTLIGAGSNTVGLTFVASGAGGGTTGTARAAYDVSGGDTISIVGTANEIDTNANTIDQIQIGLPNDITIGNNLTVTTAATVGTTLGVTGLSNLDGGIAVDTSNFTVDGTTGAIVGASTATIAGLANLNGGIAVDTSNFTVDGVNGNVLTAGTLDVAGLASLDGGIDVDAAFTVADTTGDISTTGTLSVTGATVGLDSAVTINASGNDVDTKISGDTDVNLLLVDAGTDSVLIGTSTTSAGAKLVIGTTDSIKIPAGTTGQRPSTGQNGMIRYNTSTSDLEYYADSQWSSVVSTYTLIQSETFSGTGAETNFTLATTQTTASVLVWVDDVIQTPVTDYSIVTGTTLVFVVAPASGTNNINVRELTTTDTITALDDSTGANVITANTGELTVKGLMAPDTNDAYSMGKTDKRWSSFYVENTNGLFFGPANDNNAKITYTEGDGTYHFFNSSGGTGIIDGSIDTAVNLNIIQETTSASPQSLLFVTTVDASEKPRADDGVLTYTPSTETLISPNISSKLTAQNVQVGVTGANEIDTSTGNLTIDSAGGTTTIDDILTVTGDNTTIESTTFEVQDPVIHIGDTTPNEATDDSKDRGIQFGYNDTTTTNAGSFVINKRYKIQTVGTTDFTLIGASSNAVGVVFIASGAGAGTGVAENLKYGFFGHDDSTGKFTYIPDAVNASEVISGPAGTIVATTFEGNITGDITGNVTAGNIQVGVTGANEIDTSSGNLTIDSAGGTVTVDDHLTVSGNLTVNGTTTTVNSTVTSVDDPIFTLGGDVPPVTDDNKDRGIEFRWHNGSAAKIGFFGFDDTDNKFKFIPDAVNTSEVMTGTLGTIVATTFEGNLTGQVTAQNIQVGVTGAGTIDTTAGNLTIDSAGGTTTITDHLTVTGNFTSLGIDDNATTTAITIDANENIGIGQTTIEAWNAGAYRAIQIGDGGALSGSISVDEVNLSNNAYYDQTDSQWEFIGNNGISEASNITQTDSGTIKLDVSNGTGAADAAITWATGLTINNNGSSTFGTNAVTMGSLTSTGIDDNATATALSIDATQNNVRIGDQSGAYTNEAPLSVSLDAGNLPTISSTDTVAVFNNTSATGDGANISIVAGATGVSRLNFGNTADENVGQLLYDHTNDVMNFVTNTSVRMVVEDGYELTYNSADSGSVNKQRIGTVSTTTATVTDIFNIPLVDDSTWFFEVDIAARRTDVNDESAAYKIQGAIDRNTGVGTTAIVGSVIKTIIAEDTAGWDVTAIADVTSGGLQIRVTGEGSKTIRWTSVLKTIEIKG